MELTLEKARGRYFSAMFDVMEVRVQSSTVQPVQLEVTVAATQKISVSAVEVKEKLPAAFTM